jgi:hypothetical protein
MKKLLITLMLISPFSFADTGKTISLECKMTEVGKKTYMLTEHYKNDYRRHLADERHNGEVSRLLGKTVDEIAVDRALSPMRGHYEFTLKGIEVDKDVDEVIDFGGSKFAGHSYEWEPSELLYRKHMLSLWTFATISREDLRYTISHFDTSKAPINSTSVGQCKIIQLKREF